MVDGYVLPLVVVGAGLATALAIFLAGKLLARLARRTKGTLDDQLAHRLPLPAAILAGLLVSSLALGQLQAQFQPAAVELSRRILLVLAVLVGAWGILRVLRVILDRATVRRSRFQPAARVTRRVASAIIYALAFLTILAEFGVSVTPLLTGLGLAALAIGLALQETLANFFAGIWIQTEQPLSPGHYVKLEGQGQNVEGFVERVGWRTTRIRALAGNLIVLPNSKVAQAVVTDFTMPDPTLSVVMQFRFPFDVEPSKAMAILVEEAREAAKTTPGLLEDPAPFANATPGIGEYGIGYSLIIKVREFVDQWNAQTAVTTRVWTRLQKEGIRLLYPTRINLQADGVDFAPSPVVRVSRKPHPAAAGKDPREVEADQAKQDIARRQAEEQAKRGETAPAASAPRPTSGP